MPHPCPHLQAALTRGGLLRDVRHDAEGSQLPGVISHRPIIGVSHSPGNRETATAGQTLRLRDLIEATFARAGLTPTVSYSSNDPALHIALAEQGAGTALAARFHSSVRSANGVIRLALEPPIPYDKHLIWLTADPLPARSGHYRAPGVNCARRREYQRARTHARPAHPRTSSRPPRPRPAHSPATGIAVTDRNQQRAIKVDQWHKSHRAASARTGASRSTSAGGRTQ